MKKGAIISSCGKYRYQLWRIWDEFKPLVFWLMHNPSTADGETDDPTIRKIINFSKDAGFGGLYVGNLTAYRATDPTFLLRLTQAELFPLESYVHLQDMMRKCSERVAAYGVPVRCIPPIELKNKPGFTWKVLKLTKLGYPAHPLYLSRNIQFKDL